jgi:UDP-3-O-[3-hydroxymyristoyl] N-acetylglucosamine deacetylase
MEYQTTLAAETVISGRALHNGQMITMRLSPQPENTGIVFQRSDLPGQPSIKADISAVLGTQRSMTIGKDGWKIATIEHLMAVFNGLNIDNVLIKVDGEELPVGDGSGRFFAEAVLANGLVTQNAPRRYTVITEPVWVEGIVNRGEIPDKATLLILPSDRFEVSFTFTSDHQVTGTQYYHFTANRENFLNEIAPARTIGFKREIEYLQSQGLGLGGDLNCVVLVGDTGYENELRFPEEIVRHKILDVLGDLYLLGPLLGHVVAIRSGHALDLKLAKRIFDQVGVENFVFSS